eukprot:1116611-Pyramimonas_sp.AAC.1
MGRAGGVRLLGSPLHTPRPGRGAVAQSATSPRRGPADVDRVIPLQHVLNQGVNWAIRLHPGEPMGGESGQEGALGRTRVGKRGTGAAGGPAVCSRLAVWVADLHIM